MLYCCGRAFICTFVRGGGGSLCSPGVRKSCGIGGAALGSLPNPFSSNALCTVMACNSPVIISWCKLAVNVSIFGTAGGGALNFGGGAFFAGGTFPNVNDPMALAATPIMLSDDGGMAAGGCFGLITPYLVLKFRDASNAFRSCSSICGRLSGCDCIMLINVIM